MPERYILLQEALAGYLKTGISLIGYGVRPSRPGVLPLAAGDDPGLYYFVPALKRSLNISLDQALQLFLYGTLLLALAVGIWGAWCLYNDWRSRAGASAGLLLIALVSYRIGDIYMVPAELTIALVPWFLYVTKSTSALRASIIGVVAGIALGTAHFVRGGAVEPLLVFVAILVLFGKPARAVRWALPLTMALGALLPVAGFARLVSRRNSYLAQQGLPTAGSQRVFWHNVYMGFGFLENRHGIRFDDGDAITTARTHSPEVFVGSRDYDAILRKEVLSLVRADPRFVAETLLAKLGVVSFYLIVFGGIGFSFLARRSNPFPLDSAFLAALAASTVPALLVMPWPPYLTGTIALGIAYSTIGIANQLDQGTLENSRGVSSWRKPLPN